MASRKEEMDRERIRRKEALATAKQMSRKEALAKEESERAVGNARIRGAF